MKAIVELKIEEYQALLQASRYLRETLVGVPFKDLFEDLSITRGYGNYKFQGKVSQVLIDKLGRKPTVDEIIILVDGGFSHFGAVCGYIGELTFNGRVDTD